MIIQKTSLFSLAAAIALFSSLTCFANVGQTYGFGSRGPALGGAGVSWGFDGFSAYTNPAAISLMGDRRLTVSWSALYMTPQFKPINDIVIANEYTDKGLLYGNVETDYRSTLGQTIGVNYQLFPDLAHLSFGFVGFLPLNQVAYMDTGEQFIPEYVLFRSRTQRPQIEFGASAEPFAGMFFGVGMHIGFSLTTSASVFLQSNQSQTATMRFSSSLKPKAAPYFGFLYAPDSQYKNITAHESSPAGSYSLGAVVRLPVASPNSMYLKAATNILGNKIQLDFNLDSTSALFYDPLTLELGGSVQYLSNARLYAQMDFQRWSKFEAPALDIDIPPTTSLLLAGSHNPSFSYRNIWIPRIGHEYSLGKTALRLGYAYQPGIIKEPSSEAGNYLDPSKHILTAGVGLKYESILGYAAPCQIDFHATYQRFVTQRIVKTPGNENDSGPLKIGAPGYDAGGNIFGGGATFTVAF